MVLAVVPAAAAREASAVVPKTKPLFDEATDAPAKENEKIVQIHSVLFNEHALMSVWCFGPLAAVRFLLHANSRLLNSDSCH